MYSFVRDVKINSGKKRFVVLSVCACRLDPECSGLNDMHPGVNILKVTSINMITLVYWGEQWRP
jgi:hypothetical protein